MICRPSKPGGDIRSVVISNLHPVMFVAPPQYPWVRCCNPSIEPQKCRRPCSYGLYTGRQIFVGHVCSWHQVPQTFGSAGQWIRRLFLHRGVAMSVDGHPGLLGSREEYVAERMFAVDVLCNRHFG